MWIADKLTYRGKDTYIKAYKGNELVWEKTTPPTPVFDKYLTFSVTNGMTTKIGTNANISSGVGTIYYSYDNNYWNSWRSYTNLLEVGSVGKEVLYVRGMCPNGFSSSSQKYTFTSSNTNAKLNVGGNVMALLNFGEPPMSIPSSYCFHSLFKGLKIESVSNNLLPATTLNDFCYQNMFDSCTSLVNAPALPARTLNKYCYNSMFRDCSSLTEAPALPATTVPAYSYFSMFRDCSSLVNAPALPATTIQGSCYTWMFSGCTSLITAPALPATTLGDYCYSSMFRHCSSLTEAPVLPATTLVKNCYNSIFNGCNNLNNITMLANDISADNSLVDFASGVNPTGTLTVANGMASEFPRALSGLPNDWVIVEAS